MRSYNLRTGGFLAESASEANLEFPGQAPIPELDHDTPPSEEAGTSNFKRFFLDIIETLLLSAILFIVINAVTARVRVDGYSMVPTFQGGEFIIVSKMTYKFGELSRGDILVFHQPRDPDQDYIKRVIGLPGETVRVNNEQVLIDGQALDDPYINEAPRYTGSWVVPEGMVFVLGDNRNNSSDSHSWGPLSMNNVIGRAIFVYWPFSSLGKIEHPEVVLAAP